MIHAFQDDVRRSGHQRRLHRRYAVALRVRATAHLSISQPGDERADVRDSPRHLTPPPHVRPRHARHLDVRLSSQRLGASTPLPHMRQDASRLIDDASRRRRHRRPQRHQSSDRLHALLARVLVQKYSRQPSSRAVRDENDVGVRVRVSRASSRGFALFQKPINRRSRL